MLITIENVISRNSESGKDMNWKKNRKLLKSSSRELEYLPASKTGWNFALSCLSYGSRLSIEKSHSDFSIWTDHNRLAPSYRYQQFVDDAVVLWHGTSLSRANKIADHGLFHKGGLWTTTIPQIAHSYCRNRSKRFDTDGAMICIILNKKEIEETCLRKRMSGNKILLEVK